ncbi:class I SAM-dependent methyltransferase [Bradyrhizobium sp.]
MAPTLVDLARELGVGSDPVDKPLKFYNIYDRYFSEFSGQPAALLELGVHTGASLRVWASYFPAGRIVGIDLRDPGPDFTAYPNIVYEAADQTDRLRLDGICKAHAPEGFDIIIDDASHVGYNSAASFSVLFPHLKSGGLYIVEDWGTGYYDDWQDGGHYQKINVEAVDGLVPKRLPSHDFGMVGFVKCLIDDVAGDHVRPTLGSNLTRNDTMDFMHVYKMFAIIKKL